MSDEKLPPCAVCGKPAAYVRNDGKLVCDPKAHHEAPFMYMPLLRPQEDHEKVPTD